MSILDFYKDHINLTLDMDEFSDIICALINSSPLNKELITKLLILKTKQELSYEEGGD